MKDAHAVAGRDGDARFAPTIIMRRAGGVLKQGEPSATLETPLLCANLISF